MRELIVDQALEGKFMLGKARPADREEEQS
jgi:hypothetical protein